MIMRSQQIVLILSLIIFLSLPATRGFRISTWEGVTTKHVGAHDTFGRVVGSYIDRTTGDQHVLVLGNNNRLVYVRFPQHLEGREGDITTFHLRGRVFFADIAGSGEKLYIAVARSRAEHDLKGRCSEGNTGGCQDIFYMESDNYGDTWSDPIVISRKEENDAVRRGSPVMLHIPSSGRLYIFYTYLGLAGKQLAFVTRSSEAETFGRETRCDFETGNFSGGISVVHTLVDGRGTAAIQLIWGKKNVKGGTLVMVSTSRDLGLTWGAPRAIGLSKYRADVVQFSAAAVASFPESNEIYVMATGYKEGVFLRSKDGGETWEKFKGSERQEDVVAQSLVPFIDRDGQRFLFAASTDTTFRRMFFGCLNLKKNKYDSINRIFDSNSYTFAGRLNLMTKNEEYYLYAFGTVGETHLECNLGVLRALVERANATLT